MDDDDSNGAFEMFSSQGDKKTYSVVPEDLTFKVKVILETENKRIGYTLREGTELPCDKDVGGLYYYYFHLVPFYMFNLNRLQDPLRFSSGAKYYWVQVRT